MNSNKYTTPDSDPDFRIDPLLVGRNTFPNFLKDVPTANNAVPAADLFKERLFYREGALNQLKGAESGMIDFWNNDYQFARMDPRGFAIFPSEMYLKQFTSTRNESIYGMRFFVDVFEDFVSYCERYLQQAGDTMNKGPTAIFPITVVKGWLSVRNLYHDHIQEIYKVFTEEFLKNKHSNILNFDHFITEFIEFMKIIGPQFPITFSSFILSKKVPMRINGLTVEIINSDYDDDTNKFGNFLLDTKFEFFRHAAKMHGLLIDKNIPWRLTADLSHPKMVRRAKLTTLYGKDYSYKNFFRTLYHRANQQDIFLLRHHLAGFYNAYVQFMPTVDRPTIPMRMGQKIVGTQNKWFTRQPMKAFKDGKLDLRSGYAIQYSDFYWLRFYFHIKSMEMGFTISRSQINAEIPKYYNIYRIFNFERAVNTICMDLLDRHLRRQVGSGFYGSLTRQDGDTLLSSNRNKSAVPRGGTAAPSAGAATTPSSGGNGGSGMSGGY